MFRRTKKYFQKRVERFATVAKIMGVIKEEQEVYLSVYNPGDGTKYQVQILDDGKEVISFPHNYHKNGSKFDDYLEGLLDALETLQYKKGD